MDTEKASDFIAKHTKEVGGTKQINMVSAVIELYARLKTIQMQIEELQEGMGGVAAMYEELLGRMNKLDPKIEIVSEYRAKQILKG